MASLLTEQKAVLKIHWAMKEKNVEKIRCLLGNTTDSQLEDVNAESSQSYLDLLHKDLKNCEHGGKPYLSFDDIQGAIKLHNALEKVNRVLDRYNKRNNNSSNLRQMTMRQKEIREAEYLNKYAIRLMKCLNNKHLKLRITDLDPHSSRGYLRLMANMKANKEKQAKNKSDKDKRDDNRKGNEETHSDTDNDANQFSTPGAEHQESLGEGISNNAETEDAETNTVKKQETNTRTAEETHAETKEETNTATEEETHVWTEDETHMETDKATNVGTEEETNTRTDGETLTGTEEETNVETEVKRTLTDFLPCLPPRKSKKHKPDDGYKCKLTREEVQYTLTDWRKFEDIATLLTSKDNSDDDAALKEFKSLTHNDSKIKDRMLNYMYKLDRDAEGTLVKDGEDEEELWGHNYLHLAICFYKRKSAQYISKEMPNLIMRDIGTWPDNEKKYLGLTPFHIAVANGDIELLQQMLLDMKSETVSKMDWARLLQGSDIVVRLSNNEEKVIPGAIGRRMQGTVFMGQLPLHVAMLCHINSNEDISEENEDNKFILMLELLLKGDAKLDARNYKNDTVLHTIVEFVNVFPKLESRAVDAVRYIDKKADKILPSPEDKRRFFFAQNDYFKTALQLCTEYGQVDIFNCLLALKDVYSVCLPHDDIYQMSRIDVTEIDKIAMMDFRKKEIGQGGEERRMKRLYTEKSVTELLLCLPLPVGSRFAKHDVFKMLDERKWQYYRHLFYVLFMFHILLMILLCMYAIEKPASIDPVPPYGAFVLTCQIVSTLSALVYLIQETVLRLELPKGPRLTLGKEIFLKDITEIFRKFMDQNALYRLLSVLFAVFLLIDSVLMFFSPNNWCLVFALICGTWITFFFLRAYKLFSLYTVLLNEALFGAVLPFLALIGLQLLTFTVSMYANFRRHENRSDVDHDFQNFWKSIFMMGKLMVGLTEVENLLLHTENPVLAATTFSIFVLITFLLMINALVAILTERFVSDQLDKDIIWRIQRLSIISFLEGWLTKWKRLEAFALRTGRPIKRHEASKHSRPDDRYIMSYKKVLNKEGQRRVVHEVNVAQEVSDQERRGSGNSGGGRRQQEKTLHIYYYE